MYVVPPQFGELRRRHAAVPGDRPGRDMTTTISNNRNPDGDVMSKNKRSKNNPDNANDAALRVALAANPGATASDLAFDAGMSVSTARGILARMAEDGTATRATDPDATRATYRWTLTATTGTAADMPAPPAAGDTTATPPDTATATPDPAPAPPGTAAAPAKTATVKKRAARTTRRAAKAATTTPAQTPSPAPAAPTPPADSVTDTPAGDTANAGGDAVVLEKLPSGALRGMVEDYLREHPGESFSPTAFKRALEEIHAPRQLSSGAINNALEKLTTGGVAVRTSDAPKKWALKQGA